MINLCLVWRSRIVSSKTPSTVLPKHKCWGGNIGQESFSWHNIGPLSKCRKSNLLLKCIKKNQSTQFICRISSCFYMHLKDLWLGFLSRLTEESIEGLLLVRRLLMLMCGSTKCWPAQVVLRGKPLFLVPWRMWVAGRRGIFRRGQISSVSWYPAARHPVRRPSGRRRPAEGRRRRRCCHFAAALQKLQALCCFWKSEAAILTRMIYLHNI